MKKLFFIFLFFISFSCYSQKKLIDVFYTTNKVRYKPNVVLVLYDDLKTITVNSSTTENTSKVRFIEEGVLQGDRVILYEVVNSTDKFRLTEHKETNGFLSYKITYISIELGIPKTTTLPALRM